MIVFSLWPQHGDTSFHLDSFCLFFKAPDCLNSQMIVFTVKYKEMLVFTKMSVLSRTMPPEVLVLWCTHRPPNK